MLPPILTLTEIRRLNAEGINRLTPQEAKNIREWIAARIAKTSALISDFDGKSMNANTVALLNDEREELWQINKTLEQL